MSHLTQLSLETINEEHLYYLVKMCQVDFTGIEAKDILAEAAQGLYQLWAFDQTKGVIVTQLLQHKAGRELYLYGIAGKGLIPNAEKIYSELRDYAKIHGCRWIGGSAIFEALVEKYKELGCKVASTRFVTEI